MGQLLDCGKPTVLSHSMPSQWPLGLDFPVGENEFNSLLTRLARTWVSLEIVIQINAYLLSVGFISLGFSFGLEDEDEDEREANEENFDLPSLKDKQPENTQQNRRASHFYGHAIRFGEDAFEERAKGKSKSIRPPKPR